MRQKPQRQITTVYLVIALLWILLSDSVLYFLDDTASMASGVSMVKGIMFVLVTSLILYLYLDREFGIRFRLEAELVEQMRQVRRSQTDLEQSEYRFRKAVEEAPVPIIMFDETGEILTISRTWLEITGYARDQLRTLESWTELAYGSRKQPVIAHLDELFDLEQRVDEGDYIVRCHDGSERIWEFSSTPLGRLPDNRRVVVSIAGDVTERRRAEAEARRNYNILQRIFDNSHILLAYMDAKFNFVQVNERYAQADQKTPEAFPGRNFFALYPDAENEAIFTHAVDTGTPVVIYAKPFIYPLNPERGVTYWDWSLVPVRDNEGVVEGLVLTLIDVTERMDAQQKLLESTRFVNSILRAVPNFIFIYDLTENRVVFANVGITTLLGITEDEMLGMAFPAVQRLIHPDDSPALFDRIRSSQRQEDGDYNAEVCRLQHKDGSWRWAHIQYVVFKRTETGKIQQIVGSAIDITENKQIEEQLRIKDSAIASSLTPIALADLGGHLTYINDAFLKLWKLSDAKQALGKSILEFWVSPEAAQAVVNALAQKTHLVGELTARLADGTLADIELSVSIVRDGLGNPICLMGSFNDVTKQKQAELYALENERLKARFQKEQERNVLVQRIISALSHDLRTPLTVISTSRDTLHHYYDKMTPDKRQEKLDTIGRQVQFALELLEDTVNMARGNLSEANFRPVQVNLAALCQVSVSEVGASSHIHHRLRFVNLSAIEIATVDEVLVSRILLNLLSNAIKYSPGDSEIRLELDQYESWVVLRIIDHGLGISEADLPRIFDPFYRAKNVVGVVSGSGLGLSIVKDCVERHQGQIFVESRLGQGSTFVVHLPAVNLVLPVAMGG